MDKSSFEQTFGRTDANGQFIDNHVDEMKALEATAGTVNDLIEESVQHVRQCESNCDTAFERIKAEIYKFGLPFNNENQRVFFVSKSAAMRQFEGAV